MRGAIFMKIKITGKELKITEAINNYVERKLDRIDKYFEDAEAEVTLKTEKNEQIAEIFVTAGGEKYRAVTENKDMYASIDKDIDIILNIMPQKIFLKKRFNYNNELEDDDYEFQMKEVFYESKNVY